MLIDRMQRGIGTCEVSADPSQPFDVLVRRSRTDDKAEGCATEKEPYADGITVRIIDNSPQRAMRKALAFAGGVIGPVDLYAEVV